MAAVMPACISRRNALFTEIKKLREKNTFEWGSDSPHFTSAEFQTPKSGVWDRGGEQSWKGSSRIISIKVMIITSTRETSALRGEGERRRDRETKR